jgi:maltose alpha-D-glucosyltransferase/alpha-amylase
MLHGDRPRLELAYSLLLTLPGTPVLRYGDEIGMGDDLRLPERECARTPMQWTSDRHGGFSTGRRTVLPVIRDDVFGYQRVNVADQRRDSESLLNWTERIIRMRKVCPEISWGDFSVIRTNAPEVLVIRYDWRDTSLITLHNFSNRTQSVRLTVGAPHDSLIVDLFDGHHSRIHEDGTHRLRLEPYAWRWCRVGGADNTLHLSDLAITDAKVT